MKYLLVGSIHAILWSAFTLVIWFAQKDNLYSKWVLFFLFMYISYLLSKRYIVMPKRALYLTLFNVGCYFLLKVLVTPILFFVIP